MKKIFFIIISVLLFATLVSCKKEPSQMGNDEFVPALDRNINCEIKVVGSYSNFEALLVEFDRFNEYYPNVKLRYEKLDDFQLS